MIIRNLVLALSMTLSMAAFNTVSAEEAAATAPAGDASAVVHHIEAALPLVDIKHSDPANAMVHLKEARNIAEKLQGDKKVLADAMNLLNQGMINVRSEKIEEANKWLNKAIEAYKNIK